MKKLVFIFSLLLAMTAVSCKETLPARFDMFVSSVERRCDSFSQDDWTKANDKFEKLYEEYKANRTSYNSEERSRINDSVSRYLKLVAKSGLAELSVIWDDFKQQVPSLINDAKELLNSIESAFTPSEE